MAIKKACFVKTSVKNTGKECDTSMVATAMLIAIKRGHKITDADLANPVPWMNLLIHQRIAFPLFGQQAPIREIQNSAEGDITVTLDDGLKVFLRYGLYNRGFATTSGGLCYAQALQSLNKSGYDIIEVDQTGQMLLRRNSDGTYGGLITDFMYAPSPILADFKSTPYKNRFEYTFSPIELVNNGVIFNGATELLSMMGLVDAVPFTTLISTPSTTTNIFFGVKTECAEDDLVTTVGTPLAIPSNWVVKESITGAVVVTSAGVIVGDEVKLTGTFLSGKKYLVTGSTADIWLTNNIDGYDSATNSVPATVTIP